MDADRLEELRIHAQDSHGMIGPDCPYWARYQGLPGHDPEATCGFGCVDEPSCVTDPWPAERTDEEVVWGYVLELIDEHEESLPGFVDSEGKHRCIIPAPADAWTNGPGWLAVMDTDGTTFWRTPDEVRAEIVELRDMDEPAVAADLEQVLTIGLRRYPWPSTPETCGRRSDAGYECTDDAGHSGRCTWPVDVFIDGVAYREIERTHGRLSIVGGKPMKVGSLTIRYAEVPDPPERP